MFVLQIGVSAAPAILGCLLSTLGVCSSVPPTPPSASADHLNSPTFCEGLKMVSCKQSKGIPVGIAAIITGSSSWSTNIQSYDGSPPSGTFDLLLPPPSRDCIWMLGKQPTYTAICRVSWSRDLQFVMLSFFFFCCPLRNSFLLCRFLPVFMGGQTSIANNGFT